MVEEWVTSLENSRHAVTNGLHKSAKGSCNGLSKIKEDDIIDIIKLRKEGFTYKEIGIFYDVSYNTIGSVFRKRTWAHITKDLL